MAADNHRHKLVPKLKSFLSERGVNTSLYRKDSLVKLCEAASEINLEPEEPGEYYSDKNALCIEMLNW